MNIFTTDLDPFVAASNLDDKRQNKMIIESAQMASTNLSMYGVDGPPFYKAAWHNHPSTIWARESSANMEWLCLHGIYMCEWYTSNYSKRHKTLDTLFACLMHTHIFPDIGLTEFGNASLVRDPRVSIVDSYRQTMNIKWAGDRNRPTWQGRNKPEWYRNLGGMV